MTFRSPLTYTSSSSPLVRWRGAKGAVNDERTFPDVRGRRKFALPVQLQQEVDVVDDERLKMLRWHHLKAELDNRDKQWPEDS